MAPNISIAMKTKISYPILYIQPNTFDVSASRACDMVAAVQFLKDEKHCLKYHYDVIIIDKLGNKYRQNGLQRLGKVNFLLSIKWGGG